VKIREWFDKLRRRSPEAGENERSSDGVNKAFTAGSEQAPARGFPSQQDRPRH
jgi:hypothetical protein